MPAVLCKKGFFYHVQEGRTPNMWGGYEDERKNESVEYCSGSFAVYHMNCGWVMKLINHWKSRWRWSQQFSIRTMLCITQNLHKGEYQSLVVFFFFLKFECLLWLSRAVWKSCVSLDSLGELVLLLGAAGSWALRSQRLADKSQCGQWGPQEVQHQGRVRGTQGHRGPVWWKLSPPIQLDWTIQNFKDM